MARGARIRNAQPFGRDGRDEFEGMTPHAHVAHRPRDERHMARCALAALAAGLVLSVLFDWSRRTRLKLRAMALRTNQVVRLPQRSRIRRAVDIVTGVAPHALDRHLALHVVVALHPVLVRIAIWPMGERLFP